MNRLSRIELAILRSVNAGCVQTAEIFQMLYRHRFWFIEARMYPALRSLCWKGLLECHETTERFPERGNRPRYWYTLTEKGTAAVVEDKYRRRVRL